MKSGDKWKLQFAQIDPPITSAAIVEDGQTIHIGDKRFRDIVVSFDVLPEQRHNIEKAAWQLTSVALSMFTSKPNNESIGTSKTLKELLAMRKDCIKLIRRIDGLHQEAWTALTEERKKTFHLDLTASGGPAFNVIETKQPLFDFKQQLMDTYLATERAINNLAKTPTIATPRGPKAKRVQWLTLVAARIFEELTGKRATRASDWDTGKPKSPFHTFLTAIFKTIGIEANADRQIKNIKIPAMAKKASKKAK